MSLVASPSVASLAEVFRVDPGARPHVVALWVPSLSLKSTFVHDVARIARAHGFVPVASRFITSGYSELWRGRHLLIIEDDEGAIEMRALLHAALYTSHAHVVIVTTTEEPHGLDALPMDRMDASRLSAPL